MKWKLIPLEAKEEWQNALEGIAYGFAHTWEHNYAMSLTANLKASLYCFEANNIRIVCPLAEREFKGHKDIVKPYGFNGFVGNRSCEEFPEEWRRFAKARGYVCGYLGIHPFLTDHTYYTNEEARTYNTVFALDLNLEEDELLSRMSKGRKAQIKQFQIGRSSIVREKEMLGEFLVNNYDEFLLSRGASSVYSFSKATLSYLASLDNVFLVGKSGTGGIEAAAMFAYTPYGGEYLFNVSIGEGKGHSSEIVWQGIRQLKTLGVPLVNLGGGFTPSDGIASFKKHFGSESFELKCIKQIYDEERYSVLCQQASVNPDSVDFFPAYYWKGK